MRGGGQPNEGIQKGEVSKVGHRNQALLLHLQVPH